MKKINILSITKHAEYNDIGYYGINYYIYADPIHYKIQLIGLSNNMCWRVDTISKSKIGSLFSPQKMHFIDYNQHTGRFRSNYPYDQK